MTESRPPADPRAGALRKTWLISESTESSPGDVLPARMESSQPIPSHAVAGDTEEKE